MLILVTVRILWIWRTESVTVHTELVSVCKIQCVNTDDGGDHLAMAYMQLHYITGTYTAVHTC